MKNLTKLCFLAALVLAASCTSSSRAKDGGGGAAGGTTGAGGGAGTGGIGGGTGVDAGADGPVLMDCTGLTCGSSQQVVNVWDPALGIRRCACVPIPSGGSCSDCTCGASLCAQFGASCMGFSHEAGLLCGTSG